MEENGSSSLILERFQPLQLRLSTSKGQSSQREIIASFLPPRRIFFPALTSPEIPKRRQRSLIKIARETLGRGVFTTASIPSGTIIDISPVLVLPPSEYQSHIEKTLLYHYTYNWPITTTFPLAEATVLQGDESSERTANDVSNASRKPNPTKINTQAVVFGLGSLFNHSSRGQNVGWRRDLERQVIVYTALREIHAGEELCISYGAKLTFVDADDAGDGSDQIMNGGEYVEIHEDVVELLGKIEVD